MATGSRSPPAIHTRSRRDTTPVSLVMSPSSASSSPAPRLTPSAEAGKRDSSRDMRSARPGAPLLLAGSARNVAARCLFRPLAMGPKYFEDSAADFNSRVQIVSPPPDQSSNANPMILTVASVSLRLSLQGAHYRFPAKYCRIRRTVHLSGRADGPDEAPCLPPRRLRMRGPVRAAPSTGRAAREPQTAALPWSRTTSWLAPDPRAQRSTRAFPDARNYGHGPSALEPRRSGPASRALSRAPRSTPRLRRVGRPAGPASRQAAPW